MSDAYRAGKYHAETDQPSLLASFTPKSFGWFDYLEGLGAGYNEQYWYHRRVSADAKKIARYELRRNEIKRLLREAGR